VQPKKQITLYQWYVGQVLPPIVAHALKHMNKDRPLNDIGIMSAELAFIVAGAIFDEAEKLNEEKN